VVIYLMNLLLLSVMLVLASRQITFAAFGAELGENVGGLLSGIGSLFDRFSRGASG
jgi:hypothetical protein